MLQFLFVSSFWFLFGIIFLLWQFKKSQFPAIDISSLELWDFAKTKSRRWRWNTSTKILSIIIYILLVLALSHPVWQKKNNKYLIVLDRSASMLTQVGNHTVFDRAIKEIQTLLGKFSSIDKVTLIVFPQKKIISGPPNYVALLLSKYQATHIASHIKDAFLGINIQNFDEIFLATDGAENVDSLPGKKILVGTPKTDNVGFVAVDSELIEREKWRIFFSIKNFSQENLTIPVLLQGEQTFIEKKWQIAGKDYVSSSIVINNPSNKHLTLEIKRTDNLSIDNKVYLRKQKHTHVYLDETAPTAFLKLFPKIPGVIISKKNLADVVVTKKNVNAPKVILINQPPLGAHPKKTVVKPQVYLASHPLLSWVNPNIIIPNATPIEKYIGQEIIHTKQGPIAVLDNHYLYLGFDIEKTTWINSPSFAIFWMNYFDYFFPQRYNFAYKITSDKKPFIEQSTKTYNFISEKESNNVGRFQKLMLAKYLSKTTYIFSLRTQLVYLCCFLLLLLWTQFGKVWMYKS